jgi:hypothetical protein
VGASDGARGAQARAYQPHAPLRLAFALFLTKLTRKSAAAVIRPAGSEATLHVACPNFYFCIHVAPTRAQPTTA